MKINIVDFMHHHSYIKSAFYKAIGATIFFALVYIFYSSEIVRGNVEDIAFDIVNKFSIRTKEVQTRGPKTLLFAVDDLYMRSHGLYDEYNESRYGYLFPRDHIAKFIERLDEFCSEAEPKNLPKALFIDYDMSFTSLPYGKDLSLEDKNLLNILKKKHQYKILLPKTSYYNFVQQSSDKEIQKAIKNGRIIFVSVAMRESNDGVIRRYQSYKIFRDGNGSRIYPGVDNVLWQLLQGSIVDLNEIKSKFSKDDIIANRIWIKAYKDYQQDDGCSVSQSYWGQMTKYSANCSLFDIIEEDFSGSVLMFGGTHTQNDDIFDVLDVGGGESTTGIDLHANALMTMVHLGRGMKRLPFFYSVVIVFVGFFLFSLSVSWIFAKLGINNEELELIVLLSGSAALMLFISIFLLDHYKVWFNWFIPVVLYEVVEIFDYVKDYLINTISKKRREE